MSAAEVSSRLKKAGSDPGLLGLSSVIARWNAKTKKEKAYDAFKVG